MYVVPPLGPTYIGESAKAYGLKREVLIRRTCGGTHCELGEHFGNPLGTSREHCGNTLGNMEN